MNLSLQILGRFALDVSNTLMRVNEHVLTKEEAKNELDLIKHFSKANMPKCAQDSYSLLVDIMKISIDSRNDIPKKRIYVPYIDRHGRVYNIEQFIW